MNEICFPMEYILQHSFFNKLSADERRRLIKVSEKLVFPPKKIIQKEGKDNKGIYLISKGFAKSFINRNQDKYVLWFSKEGDIVGIDSLLNGSLNKNSCITIEETLVYFIPCEIMNKILKENPELSLELLKYEAEKVNALENRIYNVHRKSISLHFAELLQMLSVKKNIPVVPSILNTQEIANVIGTTRNYVYRLIRNFEDMNIVSFKDRKLQVINNELLRKYCLVTKF